MNKKIFFLNETMFVYFNFLLFIIQSIYNYSFLPHLSSLPLPLVVYREILFALFVQIFLVFVKSAIEIFWYSNIKNIVNNNEDLAIICIFLSSTILIYSLNALYSPFSIHSFIIQSLFVNKKALMVGASASLLLLGLITGYCFVNIIAKVQRKNIKNILIFILLIGPAIAYYLIQERSQQNHKNNLSNSTNVFIIGVDSLPPKLVTKKHMPFLRSWLDRNTEFKNTITPLAKTYSSWYSILTGIEPKHHKAIENLIPKEKTESIKSIVWKFKQNGYQTIFATDERRFNNMDKEMGFDLIIGPKIGAADFIIPKFFDFPLSNLLMYFTIFKNIFPYQSINRANYINFHPENFDFLIKKALINLTKNKPVFWASHFTLPHWPYIVANSKIPDDSISSIENYSNSYSPVQYKQYLSILKKTDNQLNELYKNIKKQNLLKNSLIIFLSDHGETFYQKNSRILKQDHYLGKDLRSFKNWIYEKTGTTLNRSRGHGNDLMSLDQYSCVLGFQYLQNGIKININKKFYNWVSLIDVSPSIYDLVLFKKNKMKKYNAKKADFDGRSLKYSILKGNEPSNQSFKIYSGIVIDQNLTKEKIRLYANQLYTIDNISGLLKIKPDILFHHLVSKGTFYHPWLKVIFKKNHKIKKIVYININTREWTDDPLSSFAIEAKKYV